MAFQSNAFQSNAFQIVSVIPPIVSTIDGGAGSGKYKWTDDELYLYLEGLSAGFAKKAYEEIIETADADVRAEAASLVKQYAEDKRKVPEKVDWTGFENNLEKMRKLIAIYEREVLEREDEDILLLLA
jgi:hypothetical protein